jgi:hypothetical protein
MAALHLVGSEPRVIGNVWHLPPPNARGSYHTRPKPRGYRHRGRCGTGIILTEFEEAIMLGEKIGELTGRVITTRVIPGDDYRYIKMEVTVQQSGQVFGVDATDIGTYTVFERVPGQVYGEGQGIFGTNDGEGAIWNGHGIGKPAGGGMAMSIRYSIAFQAGANGKLARLNDVLVIGEHEVDEQGNTKSTMWEWK